MPLTKSQKTQKCLLYLTRKLTLSQLKTRAAGVTFTLRAKAKNSVRLSDKNPQPERADKTEISLSLQVITGSLSMMNLLIWLPLNPTPIITCKSYS